MKELKLEIITPTKVAFTGNIKSLTVPGSLGSFQVLFNHAPLISTFEVGSIKLENEQAETNEFATGGGTIEVKNNVILVLADSLESKEEIDVRRAQGALMRAKQRISNRNKEEIDLIRAEAALARAINRLKFANAYSSSSSD
ncbi:MAG: ATP synthase F1 subunit epsilon [Bacteroidetes bacterium]|nr:ATP synthase F1 subunit epsilon [Bacteroidota bacterium]